MLALSIIIVLGVGLGIVAFFPVDAAPLHGHASFYLPAAAHASNALLAPLDDTPTPTETPQQPQQQVVMQGHITLAGRGNPPDPRWSIPLTLTTRLGGPGGPIDQYAVVTDQSGYFTVTLPTTGTYEFHVKNPIMLANAASAGMVVGTNPVDLGLLKAG